MRRTVGGALALLVLLPAARALDEPKPPGTPAGQYKALMAEYEKGMEEFRKASRAAKTNEERQKLVKEKYPVDRLARRFLEFAEKNPKDPAALDALVLVIGKTHNTAKGAPRAKALAILARDHAGNDKLAPFCDYLSGKYDKASREALKAILDKSPNAKVKAAACFALGTAYENAADLAGRLDDPQTAKRIEQNLGKNVVEELKQEGQEELDKQAASYFERLVKEFPDARDARGNRLRSVAEGKMLGPGRAAPDIEGEDTDGKAFKLSDYKGKVVLLDFWGHW
jgi:hypothetical protein